MINGKRNTTRTERQRVITMAKSFSTRSKQNLKPRQIEIDLDGQLIAFHPPKVGPLMVALASEDESDIIRLQFKWFFDGLSPAAEKHIRDRINDPDDPMDSDTLTEVLKYLIGAATSQTGQVPNPTTRQSGSSDLLPPVAVEKAEETSTGGQSATAL